MRARGNGKRNPDKILKKMLPGIANVCRLEEGGREGGRGGREGGREGREGREGGRELRSLVNNYYREVSIFL